MPGTCYITHFDKAPNGDAGPIEASGVIAIHDFLVKVDDVSVQGMNVRDVVKLIRRASDPSVILTFMRNPRQQSNSAATGGIHLTEQRKMILWHRLTLYMCIFQPIYGLSVICHVHIIIHESIHTQTAS